jgi:hypothetical protein
MDQKETFLKDVDDSLRGATAELAKIIEASHKDFDVAIKWRQLTYGLNKDFDHWVCALSANKKAVNLVFHFGSLLEDKNKLFTKQDGKFTRKIEIQSAKDIDKAAIKDLLSQAIKKLPYFKENWKTLAKQK